MLDIFSHWTEQEEHQVPDNYVPKTTISVIVPARNESETVENCLNSILQNNYPEDLYEILCVNDQSEDNTYDIVKNIDSEKLQIINLHEQNLSGKKEAIEFAISKSNGQIILITDADCEVPDNWMKYHASFYDLHDAKCVTGPIRYKNEDSLIERFQSLDLTGMMGVTQAGIFSDKWYMANGANMSFLKKQFYDVGAFNEHKQFASGDDVFLIQSIAEIYGDHVHFLKNSKAAVTTQAEKDWSSLYQQRLRWGTKNKSYKKKAISLTLGLVFLFCLSIVLNFSLIPFFGVTAILVFSIQLISKLIIDFFYLSKLNTYFSSSRKLNSFFASSILYILYIVWIGIASLLFKNYTWKGRKLK